MALINEVINNIKNTGCSQVYIRNARAKKYTVIKFAVIDGFLTIVSEHHIFDRAIWNGQKFDSGAKEIQNKKVLLYSANPSIKDEFDREDLYDNRLNAIIGLLMAHSLNPGNAKIDYLYGSDDILNASSKWAAFLADKVIRACEVSYQDLTDFVDTDIKGIAAIFKDKIDENGDELVYPYFGSIMMSELYLNTVIKAYGKVKKIDEKTKRATTNREYKEAISSWRKLCYSTEPIVGLPRRERNTEIVKSK